MGQTIALADAERVFEGLSQLLRDRGWHPEPSENGDLCIDPNGRSEEELSLLKAWISSSTAVAHCRGEHRTALASAAKEVKKARRATDKFVKGLEERQAALTARDGLWSPSLLLVEHELRRANLIRSQLSRSLAYAQWYRGARSITTAAEWNLFVRMLCALLPTYGLTSRRIALLVYGRDNDSAVEAVKQRRVRAKKKLGAFRNLGG